MFGPPGDSPYFKWWYKDEMDAVWRYMFTNKMYKKMFISLEACYSGSIFFDLDPAMNILAMTAANPDETSKGIYCPEDNGGMIHDGKNTTMTSCMGDLFTINMMNDLDAYGKKDRTMKDFALEVTKRTDAVNTVDMEGWGGSHVQVYGDMDIYNNYTVGDFMNNPRKTKTKPAVAARQPIDTVSPAEQKIKDYEAGKTDSVNLSKVKTQDPADAGLMAIMQVWKKSGKASDKVLVEKTLKYRKFVRAIIQKVFAFAKKRLSKKQMKKKGRYTGIKNFGCLRKMIKTWEEACGPWDYFSTSYMQGVINVCENRKPIVHTMIQKGLKKVCKYFKKAR